MLEIDKRESVTGSSNTQPIHKELSLKEFLLIFINYFNYLRGKWKTLLVFCFIGAVIGFYYAYQKQPIYTATTTFVLEDDKPSGMLGQYSSIAAMAGIDVVGNTGGIFQGENIIQLYTSRTMIEKALLSYTSDHGRQQLLIDRFLEIEDLRKNWASEPRLSTINFNRKSDQQFSRIQDSILGKAVETLNKEYLFVAKPDKKIGIIQVTVNAKDEQFAKDFNESIVKTVNTFFVQTRTKKAIENIAILQHQTDSVKAVMNGAIFQSAQVSDATPNLNPARQILRAPVQRFQYNAEANKAILTQLIPNLELAKISLRKETPLIQIIDEPVYPLTKKKLSKLISCLIGAILLGGGAAIMMTFRRLSSAVINS
nr:Wzz/FepE/Etk N-terminal domain-containing protein [Mucilaginibacter sp. L294]